MENRELLAPSEKPTKTESTEFREIEKPSSGTSPLEEAVARGVDALGMLYAVTIKPGITNLWIDSLPNLDAKAVAQGFHDVMKTFVPTMACPFPTPGHLRNAIFTPQAEQAWERVWKYLDGPYHPDLGWRGGKNLLTELEASAVTAVGGIDYLYQISRDQIRWVRQQFIDIYVALSNR
jgi:hypothetical protein